MKKQKKTVADWIKAMELEACECWLSGDEDSANALKDFAEKMKREEAS